MSYDNAEPKILKTLNSSGQVSDDAGNVIGNSSNYWIRTYNQAEPKPDKILHSDGTIKDSAGNLIQNTTEFNIKKYNQAEPIPAKYLHADGTIDENAGGAGANLEDNKTATIDASTYTSPVEVTPSEGKDGMKKATITLSNIPSPTANEYAFYYWKNEEESTGYFTLSENPQVGDNAYFENDSGTPNKYSRPSKIISVSDASIEIDEGTISRDESGDIIYIKS